MKIIHYIRQNYWAFLVSLFYVALGGVVTCSMYPDDVLYGDWAKFGLLITLPVSMISFAARFADNISYTAIVIIQILVFIPTFVIISKFLAKRKKRITDSKLK